VGVDHRGSPAALLLHGRTGLWQLLMWHTRREGVWVGWGGVGWGGVGWVGTESEGLMVRVSSFLSTGALRCGWAREHSAQYPMSP
jgi:hypothetical protein